jgi:hypothetical protein
VISTEGMPETPAQAEGEPQGKRDATTGRFQPGHGSANPGGRPRRDQVVRRLARRRGASEAVALLCELLDGEAAVIVIDARAVLDEFGPRTRRGDGAPGLLAPSPPLDAADAWGEAYDRLWDAAEAEWEEAEDGSFRRPATGEFLPDWVAFDRWCEAKVAEGLTAAGLPLVQPGSVFDGPDDDRAAEDEGGDF